MIHHNTTYAFYSFGWSLALGSIGISLELTYLLIIWTGLSLFTVR